MVHCSNDADPSLSTYLLPLQRAEQQVVANMYRYWGLKASEICQRTCESTLSHPHAGITAQELQAIISSCNSDCAPNGGQLGCTDVSDLMTFWRSRKLPVAVLGPALPTAKKHCLACMSKCPQASAAPFLTLLTMFQLAHMRPHGHVYKQGHAADNCCAG